MATGRCRYLVAHDAATFVSDAVSTAPHLHREVVQVHAPAGVVTARTPATVGHIEVDGDDACVLTTGADSLAAIAAHLAWLGEAFIVVEPPALRTAVSELADRHHAARRRAEPVRVALYRAVA